MCECMFQLVTYNINGIHNPIIRELTIYNKKTGLRLNSSILNDEQFTAWMKTDIEHYLKESDNGEVSLAILWDACKAVLRRK